MRALAPILLIALAACDREPSFEERYEAAEQEIREKAAKMESDLSEGQQGEDPTPTSSPAEN